VELGFGENLSPVAQRGFETALAEIRRIVTSAKI